MPHAAIPLLVALLLPAMAGAAPCPPEEITARETAIVQVETRLGEIGREQRELQARLDDVTAGIRDVRDSTNPLKRRRLEGLMRESRSISNELSARDKERSRLFAQRSEDVGVLRRCLSDSLRSSLGRLLDAVDSKDYVAARELTALVQRVERHLSRYEPRDTPPDYPRFSDEYVADALTSDADRLFLMDTIQDVLEQARSDSAAVDTRVRETRHSVEVKRNLLSLIDTSARSNVDASAFFEEFGSERVAQEVEALEGELDELTRRQREILRAITYYVERLDRLRAAGLSEGE